MDGKDVLSFVVRYGILVFLGLFNLIIFYKIFTPLTVYPVFKIVQYLSGAELISPTVIFIKGYYANIIKACIAGSAYYLLTILNLSTPMGLKTRIKSLSFIILAFLILNIIRISVFASIVYKGYQYFDLAHAATWYFGSTILVILIWFVNIKIFNITKVPLISDISEIYNESLGKKSTSNQLS